MTAIAYKDGILAADTAGWQDDILVVKVKKIYRIGSGSLFAGCGYSSDIDAYVNWINAESGKPQEAREGFCGLHIYDDGVGYFVGRDYVFCDRIGEFAAIGAHSEFLYGAMAAGASAEQAVRLAIRMCAFAGGDVQVESIK